MDIPLVSSLLGRIVTFRRRELWNRRQLEEFQAKALARLRRHAYANSPFYREFHRGLFDAPLGDLPPLTKARLMENFDDLITDRSVGLSGVEAFVESQDAATTFRGYRVCCTSGTTGRRALFLFSPEEWVDVLASFQRGTSWAGFLVNPFVRKRLAMVTSGSPWHMSPRASATMRNWWTPSLTLDAGLPLETIAIQLADWNPDLIIAYPSIMSPLTQGYLELDGRWTPFPAPIILCGGEVLTPRTRQRIEEVWGVQPFNQYGTTEAGLMAAECRRHTGLHIFEDQVILESVDDRYHPVAPGVLGAKVLLTVLFGRTQPLIRYEVSDMVRKASTPCSCRLPFGLIEEVQGRSDEMLHVRSVNGGEISVHPIVFERILEDARAEEWQIVQQPDGIKVLVGGEVSGEMENNLRSAIHRELERQGAVAASVTFEAVHSGIRGSTGKRSWIRRNKE